LCSGAAFPPSTLSAPWLSHSCPFPPSHSTNPIG
jgi:hypothetical protein